MNAENIERICSFTTAQDGALLTAPYFHPGTEHVSVVHQSDKDAYEESD